MVESGGDVKILDKFRRDLGFLGLEERETEAEEQDRECRDVDPTQDERRDRWRRGEMADGSQDISCEERRG